MIHIPLQLPSVGKSQKFEVRLLLPLLGKVFLLSTKAAVSLFKLKCFSLKVGDGCFHVSTQLYRLP